jgi:hypothetical protein
MLYSQQKSATAKKHDLEPSSTQHPSCTSTLQAMDLFKAQHIVLGHKIPDQKTCGNIVCTWKVTGQVTKTIATVSLDK